MDFSKVKSFSIPEGNVKSISIGSMVVWQAEIEAEQLVAPTISLDGDTLTITAGDENTETFAILVDGVEMATVANSISFTLCVSEYDGTITDTQTLTVPSGMTWSEWVETTDYTVGGNPPIISSSGDITNDTGERVLRLGVSYSDSERVIIDDIIKANTTYSFVSKSK